MKIPVESTTSMVRLYPPALRSRILFLLFISLSYHTPSTRTHAVREEGKRGRGKVKEGYAVQHASINTHIRTLMITILYILFFPCEPLPPTRTQKENRKVHGNNE